MLIREAIFNKLMFPAVCFRSPLDDSGFLETRIQENLLMWQPKFQLGSVSTSTQSCYVSLEDPLLPRRSSWRWPGFPEFARNWLYWVESFRAPEVHLLHSLNGNLKVASCPSPSKCSTHIHLSLEMMKTIGAFDVSFLASYKTNAMILHLELFKLELVSILVKGCGATLTSETAFKIEAHSLVWQKKSPGVPTLCFSKARQRGPAPHSIPPYAPNRNNDWSNPTGSRIYSLLYIWIFEET